MKSAINVFFVGVFGLFGVLCTALFVAMCVTILAGSALGVGAALYWLASAVMRFCGVMS